MMRAMMVRLVKLKKVSVNWRVWRTKRMSPTTRLVDHRSCTVTPFAQTCPTIRHKDWTP